MSRTNIDIDEAACAEVMRRYRLVTKRDAVNFALRTLAAEPLTDEGARRLRGSGWDGDLETVRTNRTSSHPSTRLDRTSPRHGLSPPLSRP